MSKYYVIFNTENRGIYDTWGECQEKTKGVSGVKFKSFKNRSLAETALNENLIESKENEKIKDLFPKIGFATDGACNVKKRIGQYQIYDLEKNKMIFTSKEFENTTNNQMEFLALMHALILCEDLKVLEDIKYDNYPIYTDSITAISWLKNNKLNSNIDYDSIVGKEIKKMLNWLKNNQYNNKIIKWETKNLGEIPADFGRK